MNLVADSLELVCPTKRASIRAAASASEFDFNRKTREWTGVFGSFGEFAVPDSKPVAIPSKHREEVQSTLSHNGAQFADCTNDEQPPPQSGDDQFGVTFMGKDESGFTLQVTGVDSNVQAALSMCLALGGSDCGLTAPGGTSVPSRAVDLTVIRPQVYSVHVGLDAETLKQVGEWTFALDLGDGRTARTTFDIP